MGSYLDRILEAHRARVAADDRPFEDLLERACGVAESRGFAAGLAGRPGLSVVAEIKRRSPSRGALAPGLDPGALAAAYEQGGAAALSVLTDEQFFGGSAADLRRAREATSVPVLRKDFTLSPADVCDARIMGADAILLIASALTDAELSALIGLASRIGLDALVEVHDQDEIVRSVAAGATLIGVNQRDLRSFEVDRSHAARVAGAIPNGVVKLAESGVQDPTELAALALSGYDAVLVGESVVTSPDPRAAVSELVRAGAQPLPVGRRAP